MKRLGLYLIIIYNVVMLSCCHDSLVPPEGPSRDEAERTVIVYMAGDNSLSPAIRLDTTEMARAKSLIPENVNFILYIDDKTRMPALYELSAKNGMQLLMQYEEEHCSTDSLTMLSTLRDIVYLCPARHYGITFWSHATGWAPLRKSARRNTFGKDETYEGTKRSEMEISDLRDILSQLPHFDYIFFDACFMQCIEVAYELRNVTDYMVGSPAETPGPGAPYDKVISALCQGNARGIVEGYDAGYPATYSGYYYKGVLLSCIDCAQLEPLAEATGRFLTPHFMERKAPSTQGFQAYSSYLNKFTHYFDMRTTMRRLLSDEDYAVWMQFFDKAVPLHTLSDTRTWFANFCKVPFVDDPDCYGGVSMFVPLEEYEAYGWNKDFSHTSWYEAAGWPTTGW